MADWRVEGAGFRYEGGADPSADVSHGFKFTLVREGSPERSINVEAANAAEVGMSEADARRAVAQHLGEDEPPLRIGMARDGSFHAITD